MIFALSIIMKSYGKQAANVLQFMKKEIAVAKFAGLQVYKTWVEQFNVHG